MVLLLLLAAPIFGQIPPKRPGFGPLTKRNRNPLAPEWQRAVDRYADMGSGSSGLAAVHEPLGENAELGVSLSRSHRCGRLLAAWE
jgi:hypothetical protein